MTVAAIIRFTFREDVRDRVPQIVDDMLAQTRTFAGLEQLDILIDPERPDVWTLYEIWTDVESENVYREFRRTPEGAIPVLAEVLAGPPTIENYQIRA